MRWKKLGLIWEPNDCKWWARSHSMAPTALRMSDDAIRIFITSLDEHGVGRPGYVDVDSHDPTRIRKVSEAPLMDVGMPGCFDDNGVVCSCVIADSQRSLYMYYVGFETLTRIRYRLFTGLALSSDGGETFHRVSQAPILDRIDAELFFRGAPFVVKDAKVYRMWYVAGSEWVTINHKVLPVYDLRYLESEDGIRWPNAGKIAMPVTNDDEHGFGRPWVVPRGPDDYQLFYCIRKRSLQSYRLGYAESRNGLEWTRKDDEVGLTVSETGWDSEMICNPCLIDVEGKRYMFYNGNRYGSTGFGCAVLESL